MRSKSKEFKKIFESEYNFLEGFKRNVFKTPGKTAIIDAQKNISLTYSQLYEKAYSLSENFYALGVKKGSVVFCLLRNSIDFACVYIASKILDSVFLPANFKLSEEEISLLIKKNKPKVVIYSPCCSAQINKVNEKSKNTKYILADNFENIKCPANHYELFSINKRKELKQKNKVSVYDETVRLCTSGTTSLPKCIPLTQLNEVLSVHDVLMHLKMDSTDTTMNLTPWFHRGGLHSAGLCPVLYSGAACVVVRSFSPQNSIKWISDYKVTYVIGSPSTLKILAGAKKHFDLKNNCLKNLVSMGNVLSNSDIDFLENTFSCKVINGYGTTETFWNVLGEKNSFKACIEDDVRIVKLNESSFSSPDDLVPFDNQTCGEIIIKSVSKSSFCYFQNKEIEKQKFYNGWFYTGDLAVWDKDKNFSICGRKDNMFVVSGENIYPEQIEAVICTHPKVKDCLVKSENDSLRGKSIALYVEKKDESLTEEELKAFCNDVKNLSKYKRPRHIYFVEKIALNATGKKIRD